MRRYELHKSNFINFNSNDELRKLPGTDLTNLILEMEKYFLSLRETINLDDYIGFGLELEFEEAKAIPAEDSLKDFPGWLYKSDGTVWEKIDFIDYGGELVSPILYDKEETWLDLDKICKTLLMLKATAEEKAAGHIHFGSQIIGNDYKHWVNLIKLWTFYENIIYRFSFGEQTKGRDLLKTYAYPESRNFKFLLDFLNKYNNTELLITKLRKRRKVGISFAYVSSGKFAKYNTLEVRCPNMSFNSAIWQNNVNFFAKLFLYCKSNNFDEEFINQKLKKYKYKDYSLNLYHEIYLEEALELTDLIFDNNKDKIYLLKQYLKGFNLKKDTNKSISL